MKRICLCILLSTIVQVSQQYELKDEVSLLKSEVSKNTAVIGQLLEGMGQLRNENQHLRTDNSDLQRRIAELESSRATPIAFLATTSTDQGVGAGATVIFHTVNVNEGNGFDPATSQFVCPTTGFYFFAYSLHTMHDSGITARITKQGGEGPRIYGDGMGRGTGNGAHAGVIQCNQNERVWVAADGGTVRGGSYSSFSGMLLFQ